MTEVFAFKHELHKFVSEVLPLLIRKQHSSNYYEWTLFRFCLFVYFLLIVEVFNLLYKMPDPHNIRKVDFCEQ